MSDKCQRGKSQSLRWSTSDGLTEMDPIRKKEVVRVILKEILIKDRRIVSFELFEPFKSFLEGKE